ncbi:MAG: HIT family protein [Bacteroidaceae bacterium]|jgi:histidine triad (HIT) family protein|nr:HIT family protein [Bacilli bacterium]MDD2530185.1 HIT family protein [Bacteroidales bacterium]MEA4968007.1 HIT family protein [Bacteroidaceae bacterium]NCC19137.1 HIT family protein [Bacteroidia bacterium]MDY4790005.1 HIT family protein [Bacteroidales bacterium]
MSTIFSKIISGEIPCYKIAETENCFAFLDISPLAKGHTLVVPKKEIDYIFDIEDKLLCELNIFAKQIAKAVQKAYPCPKVGIAVIGLEVPHAHIHLVPLNNVGDLDFKRPKLELSKEEFEEIAKNIISYLK